MEHVKALQETMKGNPTPPTIGEMVEELTEGEILAGFGVVRLITRDEEDSVPVELEMRNPIVKASTGTSVTFVLAYWAGALSTLLNKRLDATDTTYDPNTDILKCKFAAISA